MTDAYARLSMKIGYFAGAVDMLLGGERFTNITRGASAYFTEPFYLKVQELAGAAGVPVEYIQDALHDAELLANNEEYMALAKAFQDLIDEQA